MHVNKVAGRVTILLHSIWDARETSAQIWTFDTQQWLKDGRLTDENRTMTLLESMFHNSCKEQKRSSPLITISRHCQSMCRADGDVFMLEQGAQKADYRADEDE